MAELPAKPLRRAPVDIFPISCHVTYMNDRNPNADDIIATLRANADALRARRITHAALFGSRAWGDNTPDSDIDILIETRPDAIRDPVPVDVVNREFLKPSIRPAAEADVIHAF